MTTDTDHIAIQFADLPEVACIYRDGNHLYVFTSNETYDDSLMSRLLETEIEWLHYNPRFLFEYFPLALVVDPANVLPSTARQVFAR